MAWVIIISIVLTFLISNQIKKDKKKLADDDLVLFNKYRDMMKGKLSVKQLEDLTGWERHIWLMAKDESETDRSKNLYIVLFVVILLGVFILMN